MSRAQRLALIVAGGTGGHIFPGLSVASELKARGWQVQWAGNPEAMEGRLEMTECSGEHSQCEHETHCGMQNHWQKINDVIAGALKSVSITELGGAPARVARVEPVAAVRRYNAPCATDCTTLGHSAAMQMPPS